MISEDVTLFIPVSILDRPEGQSLRVLAIAYISNISGVSILDRPEGQSLL